MRITAIHPIPLRSLFAVHPELLAAGNGNASLAATRRP